MVHQAGVQGFDPSPYRSIGKIFQDTRLLVGVSIVESARRTMAFGDMCLECLEIETASILTAFQ